MIGGKKNIDSSSSTPPSPPHHHRERPHSRLDEIVGKRIIIIIPTTTNTIPLQPSSSHNNISILPQRPDSSSSCRCRTTDQRDHSTTCTEEWEPQEWKSGIIRSLKTGSNGEYSFYIGYDDRYPSHGLNPSATSPGNHEYCWVDWSGIKGEPPPFHWVEDSLVYIEDCSDHLETPQTIPPKLLALNFVAFPDPVPPLKGTSPCLTRSHPFYLVEDEKLIWMKGSQATTIPIPMTRMLEHAGQSEGHPKLALTKYHNLNSFREKLFKKSSALIGKHVRYFDPLSENKWLDGTINGQNCDKELIIQTLESQININPRHLSIEEGCKDSGNSTGRETENIVTCHPSPTQRPTPPTIVNGAGMLEDEPLPTGQEVDDLRPLGVTWPVGAKAGSQQNDDGTGKAALPARFNNALSQQPPAVAAIPNNESRPSDRRLPAVTTLPGPEEKISPAHSIAPTPNACTSNEISVGESFDRAIERYFQSPRNNGTDPLDYDCVANPLSSSSPSPSPSNAIFPFMPLCMRQMQAKFARHNKTKVPPAVNSTSSSNNNITNVTMVDNNITNYSSIGSGSSCCGGGNSTTSSSSSSGSGGSAHNKVLNNGNSKRMAGHMNAVDESRANGSYNHGYVCKKALLASPYPPLTPSHPIQTFSPRSSVNVATNGPDLTDSRVNKGNHRQPSLKSPPHPADVVRTGNISNSSSCGSKNKATITPVNNQICSNGNNYPWPYHTTTVGLESLGKKGSQNHRSVGKRPESPKYSNAAAPTLRDGINSQSSCHKGTFPGPTPFQPPQPLPFDASYHPHYLYAYYHQLYAYHQRAQQLAATSTATFAPQNCAINSCHVGRGDDVADGGNFILPHPNFPTPFVVPRGHLAYDAKCGNMAIGDATSHAPLQPPYSYLETLRPKCTLTQQSNSQTPNDRVMMDATSLPTDYLDRLHHHFSTNSSLPHNGNVGTNWSEAQPYPQARSPTNRAHSNYDKTTLECVKGKDNRCTDSGRFNLKEHSRVGGVSKSSTGDTTATTFTNSHQFGLHDETAILPSTQHLYVKPKIFQNYSHSPLAAVDDHFKESLNNSSYKKTTENACHALNALNQKVSKVGSEVYDEVQKITPSYVNNRINHSSGSKRDSKNFGKRKSPNVTNVPTYLPPRGNTVAQNTSPKNYPLTDPLRKKLAGTSVNAVNPELITQTIDVKSFDTTPSWTDGAANLNPFRDLYAQYINNMLGTTKVQPAPQQPQPPPLWLPLMNAALALGTADKTAQPNPHGKPSVEEPLNLSYTKKEELSKRLFPTITCGGDNVTNTSAMSQMTAKDLASLYHPFKEAISSGGRTPEQNYNLTLQSFIERAVHVAFGAEDVTHDNVFTKAAYQDAQSRFGVPNGHDSESNCAGQAIASDRYKAAAPTSRPILTDVAFDPKNELPPQGHHHRTTSSKRNGDDSSTESSKKLKLKQKWLHKHITDSCDDRLPPTHALFPPNFSNGTVDPYPLLRCNDYQQSLSDASDCHIKLESAATAPHPGSLILTIANGQYPPTNDCKVGKCGTSSISNSKRPPLPSGSHNHESHPNSNKCYVNPISVTTKPLQNTAKKSPTQTNAPLTSAPPPTNDTTGNCYDFSENSPPPTLLSQHGAPSHHLQQYQQSNERYPSSHDPILVVGDKKTKNRSRKDIFNPANHTIAIPPTDASTTIVTSTNAGTSLVPSCPNVAEPFLQSEACNHLSPKLPKCWECRLSLSQRNQRLNIFCRFYAFRKLKVNSKGTFSVAGFSETYEANSDDLKVWLPPGDDPFDRDGCDFIAGLDMKVTCLYIFQTTLPYFVTLIKQEEKALEAVSGNSKIAWKRPVEGVREMCDPCQTTLFNRHWVCPKCGFAVCLDCYIGKKRFLEVATAAIHTPLPDLQPTPGKSFYGGENTFLTNLRESAIKSIMDPTTDNNSDDFPWLPCTNRQPHEPSKLMATHIIPNIALTEIVQVCEKLVDKYKCHGLLTKPTEVTCQKMMNVLYKDLSDHNGVRAFPTTPNTKVHSNITSPSGDTPLKQLGNNSVSRSLTALDASGGHLGNPEYGSNGDTKSLIDYGDCPLRPCPNRLAPNDRLRLSAPTDLLNHNASPLSWLADVALSASTRIGDASSSHNIDGDSRETATESGSQPPPFTTAPNNFDIINHFQNGSATFTAKISQYLSSPKNYFKNLTPSNTLDDVITAVIEQSISEPIDEDVDMKIYRSFCSKSTSSSSDLTPSPTSRGECVTTSNGPTPDYKCCYVKGCCPPDTKEPVLTKDLSLPLKTPLYGDIPHSWLCEGKVLHLKHRSKEHGPINGDDRVRILSVFRQAWTLGYPVLVSGIHESLDPALWNPEWFARAFGQFENDIINCRKNTVIKNLKMKEFWEGFTHFSKRIRDELPDSEPMVLKLKDWPSSDDFAEILPKHYNDLSQALPLPDYTQRCGIFNLASRLPPSFVKPDLGPKMYNAYGSARYPTHGSTNLHIDISDATNVMAYVGIPHDEPDQDYYFDFNAPTPLDKSTKSENCVRHPFSLAVWEAIKDSGADEDTLDRITNGSRDIPGAIWHIYKADDVPKIRQFLIKLALETGKDMMPHHDPIHDQEDYLTREMNQRLHEEYNVSPCVIIQCLGDAIFIPAGAPHQVRNLYSCIKVAEDFVSPEHVGHCLRLTEEFRRLSDSHTNHEDKLQIKNIIYHTVKDVCTVLNSNPEPK